MKKSYTGLILWMIAFGAVITALCCIPFKDEGLMLRLILNSCSVFVAVLMYIIYKTDKIYWLNIISYEDIVKSDYQRQKIYTQKIFKRFSKFAVGYLIFSSLLQIANVSIWPDLIVFMIGFISVTFSTTTIKL